MLQLFMDTARAVAIGIPILIFGAVAAHLLIHRKVLPWAASLLGQHQGGNVTTHEGLL